MTLVMMRYFSFSCLANSTNRAGSVGSGGSVLPADTEQNPQFRVQILPRIKTVAVPLALHSP